MLCGITLSVAGVVALIPGLSRQARHALGFQLTPQPVDLSTIQEILAANTRFCALLGLATFAVRTFPELKPLADVSIGISVTANTALVGVALGAYGHRAPPWLIHVPAEWAAIALCLSLYTRTRGGPHPTPTEVVTISVTTLGVLIAAAIIETYGTPHS